MQKIDRINQAKIKTADNSNENYDVTDAIHYEKNDIGKLILRLTIGGLMLFHGLDKLMNGTAMVGEILADVGVPSFFAFAVLLAEVLAPVMLILGFKVRVAAFLIIIDMFMATLLVHSSDVLKVNELGGWMLELNALYLLGSLSIIFLGSGHYAITKGKGALD